MCYCSGMTDPLCASPSVRLLRVCEERQHGTLDNIDALLGKYTSFIKLFYSIIIVVVPLPTSYILLDKCMILKSCSLFLLDKCMILKSCSLFLLINVWYLNPAVSISESTVTSWFSVIEEPNNSFVPVISDKLIFQSINYETIVFEEALVFIGFLGQYH